MARLTRTCPVGVAQHIIQRGNNRQICFADTADMHAYLGWLTEYANKYSVAIHAWVLMTNHVHILCTPLVGNGTSLMMQSLGRVYVRYFNHKYIRTGTLWEGRFKSCLVQDETYLLCVYRYIELNPVSAGMVDEPAEYAWSSYRCNALGRAAVLCSPHGEYLGLGRTAASRQSAYRALFSTPVEPVLKAQIKLSLQQGLALGSDRFKLQIEAVTGGRLTSNKTGKK